MRAHPLPASLVRAVTTAHPHEGPLWLATLPTLIADYAQRWQLTAGAAFPDLSTAFVAPAQRADGSEAVLKIGISRTERSQEIEALRLFAGRGAVPLLEADHEHGALLLERLRPGLALATLDDDDEATRQAATVMRRLWRPAPSSHPFPTVADWANGLQHYHTHFPSTTGPIPAHLLAKAERLMAALLASAPAPVLLHGDLHHFNMVSADPDGWGVIDPKGVVGEPAYEVGRFLLNPPGVLAQPHAHQLVERRLALMAEALALDPQRMAAWGFCKAILSAWWCLEDGDDSFFSYCLTCAEVMDAVVLGMGYGE